MRLHQALNFASRYANKNILSISIHRIDDHQVTVSFMDKDKSFFTIETNITVKPFCVRLTTTEAKSLSALAKIDEQIIVSDDSVSIAGEVFLKDEPLPPLPEMSINRYVGELSPDHLLPIIGFASKNEARFNLNGIFFDSDERKFVATDGHRLATHEAPTLSGAPDMILPINSLIALLAMKPKKPVSTKDTYFRGNHEKIGHRYLEVSFTDLTAHIRLLDGDYPSYKKVIPASYEASLEMRDKAPLITALKGAIDRAKPSKKTPSVEISCNGQFVVSQTIEEKTISWAIPDVKYDREFSFLVNPCLLLDQITALKEKAFVLDYQKEGAPLGIFFPENYNFHSILMPMRK